MPPPAIATSSSPCTTGRCGRRLCSPEHLDLSDRRQLFDAGGGPGTFSIFLVRRHPGLRAIIFDLPQTIAITREIVGASDVADRISFQPGNYFEDGFGDGNDVVLLAAILHSMGPERSLMLLRKASDSLVAGGIVVVNEGLVNADGTGPLSAVLFSLNMLVKRPWPFILSGM